MLHGERVTGNLEVDNVAHDRGVELRGEPRTEVATLRGEAKHDRPIAGALRAGGDRCSNRFALEGRERRMLERNHDVGAISAKRFGFLRDTRRSSDEGMYFLATRRVAGRDQRASPFDKSDRVVREPSAHRLPAAHRICPMIAPFGDPGIFDGRRDLLRQWSAAAATFRGQ